jgi:hypothetical protein
MAAMKSLLPLLALFALGASPDASAETWLTCATENSTCQFDGNRRVAFGAKGKYAYRNMNGPIACNAATFGSDPIPNVKKSCRFLVAASVTNEAPAAPKWQRCADEGFDCNFAGPKRVVFGTGNKWVRETFVSGVPCKTAVFGDPAPGVKKSCWIAAR